MPHPGLELSRGGGGRPIAALSAILGVGFAELERQGASRRAIWAAVLLTAFSVSNGLYVVTVWKDITYSVGLVALSVVAMKIAFSRGRWCHRTSNLAAMVLLAVVTASVRHNGAVTVFGTLLVLALCWQEVRRPLLGVLVTSLLLYLGVQGPLYRALQVEPMPHAMRYEVPLYYLAAHVRAGSALTPAERAFVDSVPSTWIYSPHHARDLVNGTDLDFIAANRWKLVRTTLGVSLRHPLTTIRHAIDTGTVGWRITIAPGGFAWTACEFRWGAERRFRWVRSNKLGLAESSRLPAIERWYTDRIAFATCTPNSASFLITWRSAQYLYLFLGAVLLLAVRRRQWGLATIAAPIVAHTLPLALATISQDFRYHYAAYILGWSFTLPLLSLLRTGPSTAGGPPPPGSAAPPAPPTTTPPG